MIAARRLLVLIAATMFLAPMAVADDDLRHRVEQALASHPVASSLAVEVDVADGAVVLEGEVDDPESADAVAIAVARLPGVETIINRIRIS